MKQEKWDKLTPEVKKIILDEAIGFGFDLSTIDKIDYKFWEDIQLEDIVISLASRLASNIQIASQALHELRKFREDFSKIMPNDTKSTSTIIIKDITKEQMAEMLNERVYRDEITKEEEQIAKENGLVVVFGASDDLMELRGVISDEFGTEIFLTENGEIEYCDDNCEHYERAVKKAKKIKAIHGKNGWVFETEIPFAEFDIFEDGQLYGKGIVFDIESLK